MRERQGQRSHDYVWSGAGIQGWVWQGQTPPCQANAVLVAAAMHVRVKRRAPDKVTSKVEDFEYRFPATLHTSGSDKLSPVSKTDGDWAETLVFLTTERLGEIQNHPCKLSTVTMTVSLSTAQLQQTTNSYKAQYAGGPSWALKAMIGSMALSGVISVNQQVCLQNCTDMLTCTPWTHPFKPSCLRLCMGYSNQRENRNDHNTLSTKTEG